MKLIISVLVIAATFSIIACTKGGQQEGVSGSQFTVSSTASSKQLIPAIDTTSTGTFTGFYDDQTNILTYTLAWNDLWRTTSKDTITSVNFYGPASAASNGTLVRSLPFVNTNNVGSINLGLAGITGFTANEKKDFLASAYYFTINTKKYPNGIIRAQLAVAQR
jgi:hypothetical protein